MQAESKGWLDPGQPMLAYVMRGHTSKAWTNATLSFYAATPNGSASAGAYQLDGVTLAHRSQQPANRTDCVDPLARRPAGRRAATSS